MLKGVVFKCLDYKDAHPHGYVVYCDPPYINSKEYANATSFNYDEFWDKMREWSQDNIVLVSEQMAPDDWKAIWSQSVSRSIKTTDKSRATEKLYIYGG